MRTKLFFCFLAFWCGANAQYSILYNFSNETPDWGALTISGSKLYGMTINGGTQDSGSIFSVDTSRSGYKTLFNFNGANGKNPCGSLTLSGSKFFGMTQYGGTNHIGIVFTIDSNGNNFKDLYNIVGGSGGNPWGSLAFSGDTLLFGMTNIGDSLNFGGIFSIDTNGSNFLPIDSYGSRYGTSLGEPLSAVTVSDNELYAMFLEMGHYGYGSIESMNFFGGNFKIVLDFNGTNGAYPSGSLILAGNTLYGMTQYGGANDSGCIFSIHIDGKEYKDMLDFNGANGAYPIGSLVLSESRLYGVTYIGGAHDSGCIFSIDTNGTNYEDMFDFNRSTGCFPSGSLIPSSKVLYGMTRYGGANDSGVVFAFRDTNIKTSIIEFTATTGAINVYPNPNNGRFTIEFVGTQNFVSTIEVYNVLGEKVFTETLRSTQGDNTIDIGNQSSGIYFYRVVNEDGSLVGEGKVIIEK